MEILAQDIPAFIPTHEIMAETILVFRHLTARDIGVNYLGIFRYKSREYKRKVSQDSTMQILELSRTTDTNGGWKLIRLISLEVPGRRQSLEALRTIEDERKTLIIVTYIPPAAS